MKQIKLTPPIDTLKLIKLFPKNTVTIIHDGEDFSPYGLIMVLEGPPMLLPIWRFSPEEALKELIMFPIISQEDLTCVGYNIDELKRKNVSLIARTSCNELTEKLKMQALLDLPLSDIMEKV
jgi:hypothetical protein